VKNDEQVVLPGGVRVYQDPGASVTTDTLLLASSLHVSPGSVIADIGCGSGGASICSSALNPGCRWIGIDIRYDTLKLMMASKELQKTEVDITAVCCSLETVPFVFAECIADAVILNPPYGRHGSIRKSPDSERDRSRAGSDLLLYQFIRGAAHLLVKGGEFLIINKPALLPEILLGCRAFGINPVEIQPVGSEGKPAERIILKGRKGSREELKILPRTEWGRT
jgi:tRNA1(Val) A37 N6-methylase TrmN6